MWRIPKILPLLILSVIFFIKINCPVGSQGKNVEQERPNSLRKLHFIPQHDLIVAVCGSVPNGTIRF
jgi:hypothetical protein